MSRCLHIYLAALALAALTFPGVLHAATSTWDGGGDGVNWSSSPANWIGDAAPVAGDDLIFGTPGAATNNDFAAGRIFNSITFNGDAFTLGGNGITLGTSAPFGTTGSGNITSTAAGLQTISLGVNVGAGNHTIAGGAGGIALNVAGGTVKSAGGGGTAIFSGTMTSSTINNVGSTGILGGYATVGTNWATVSGGSIVAYSGYTSIAPGTAIADDANSNVKINAAGTANTLANAGTTNINTLIYDTNTAQAVNMVAGQTLRLGQFGGIFRTGTTNAITFSIGNTAGTGSLTAGGNATNVPGEIVLNGGAGTGTGTQMTVNANIVNNGTGAVALIKTGRGYANLTGTANNYSGGTFINEGRLQAAANGSLGTGLVTIQSGGEAFLGNFTWNNNWLIAGAGPQNENGNGAIRASGTVAGTVTMFGDAGLGGGGTYTGKITGGFNLQLGSTANVGGTGSLIILANANANNTANGNDWTGNTTIVARTGGTGNNTIIRFGASEQIPNGATAGNLQFGANNQTVSTARFDLNGFNETVNGLSVVNGTASLMSVNSTAAATLAVGDNNATSTFAGNLTGAGLAVTKIGSGTLTLSGTNTHVGATTVNAGTLALSSATANNIANSLNVIVGGSGTLDTNGLAGGMTVATGQSLINNGVVNGNVTATDATALVKGNGSYTGTVTVNGGAGAWQQHRIGDH